MKRATMALILLVVSGGCKKGDSAGDGIRPVRVPRNEATERPAADARSAADSPRGRFVSDIPGVDAGRLSPEQKQIYLAVMNDELCSCNHPHTAAQCLIDRDNCGSATKMGRFVVRKLGAGVGEKAIRRSLEAIFGERHRRHELSLKGVPRIGPENAKVSLVEFSDFQCPMCKHVQPVVKAILAQHGGAVAYYSKPFPLPQHAEAHTAAQAAESAGAQGKFWAMKEALFRRQETMGAEAILDAAKEVGVDVDRVKRDLETKRFATAVDKSREEGVAAGVHGTPSFFVNGVLVKGPPTEENLRDWIDAALDN